MSAQLEEREGGKIGTDFYYSPEFKARALVLLQENACNYTQTAKELGIERSTLWRWHQQGGVGPAVLQRATELKEGLAARWHERTEAALEHMTDEKLGNASARDLGIIAGVGTDKVLNLLGEGPGREAPSEAAQIALKAIEALYRLALERDASVTKEEVTRRYCEQRPELRPLLLKSA